MSTIGNEPNLTVREQAVTPELARHWLELREPNRAIRQNRVVELANLMTSGGWEMNGQGIIFDIEGKLVDGQHRLSAVVLSGTTQRMLIIWGVAKTAMANIDTGITRTNSDVIGMAGYSSSKNLASFVHLLCQYERYGGGWALGQQAGQRGRISPQEQLQRLNREPQALTWALEEAIRLVPQAVIQPSLSAFLLWVFTRQDFELGLQFMARLGDGVDLQKGNPVLALRERFADMRRGSGMRGPRKYSRTIYIALAFKAWNAYRLGRPVRTLTIKASEDFPEIDD